jgi:hypothetical protein
MKLVAMASRRVKAAVARRGRRNRLILDKLKSVVAAMTRQHRHCRQPQPVPRTMFSRM